MQKLYYLVYRGFEPHAGPWVLVKIFEYREDAYSYVESQGEFKKFFKVECFEN